ncbi:hypothetical protein H2198_003963 [Neophaeococcomyces mojaviensis]|uniref:Uncharacterized protein n=1 Tax=Neophaeococcomyces mojaviensis TaxID=3383035 RepID=A0ACC3A9V4_9EURO|nr:hypothetical protein H2198_003963 [Knufia sp. JES_112]
MSIEERRQLLERYLPDPPQTSQGNTAATTSSKHKSGRRRRVRPFLKQKLYLFFYLAIQFIFGIYIRVRQIASAIFQKFIAVRHYHHRTPAYIQKDLKNLSRSPEHLSVILKFDSSADDGLETLLDEVAELSAWSASAGISLLSIYEKSGILKQYMSAVEEIVQQKLVLYFGAPPATPTLRVFAPNVPSIPPTRSTDTPATTNEVTNGENHYQLSGINLNLLLLSQSDGRDTLVDLTRTLTEMAQGHKLRPKDITVDLIDAEISAITSIPPPAETKPSKLNGHINGVQNLECTLPSEPDLLIVFAPYIKLDGYPPWQIRLTEIFCVGDSGGDVSGRQRTRVEYQAFLRALWSYAGAEFRFGS